MSCPDDDTILAFFEGELAPDAAAAIEHHLDACPGCRILFSRIARAAADDPPLGELVPTERTEQPTSGSAPAASASDEQLPGSEVGHYQIVRLLGRGGMGEVYLARDTRLGRKVALKMIRPGVLGSPAARDRFLFEARTTARFNHPHIVTIHDVGEDGGRPYLALEYLRGESLRQRLARERPGALDVIRIGAAIAEALAEAHRHGVLHRDLKPENVFLPGDGRLRVLDFGLAKALGPERAEPRSPSLPASVSGDVSLRGTEGACGSPAYMAPEQWAGEECAATDLWALGVILFELTSGRLPYRAPSAAELAAQVCSPDPAPRVEPAGSMPHGLVALINDCLSKQPDARPDAPTAILRLRELLARAPASAEEPPFRGLLPFDERHRHLFFGRDAEIARFVDRLRETPTMPVLGTSGAGKSSFVRAGVIPRLRERGPLTVLQLRPGPNPFLALAARISAARDRPSGSGDRSPFDPSQESHPTPSEAIAPAGPGEPGAADLAEALFRSPPLLSLTLHRLSETHRAGVLLFVDQLEELYTLVPDPEHRRRFAEALCGAADDPAAPVRVIFTLRQEFLSHLAESPESRAVLDQITVLRGPAPAMLAEALTRPLEAVGYRYDDPSLVQEMVEVVKGEPASLPLLQFAGEQLWEHRDREARLLRRSAYTAIGGVAGALAHHADGVLDGLLAPSVELARTLLLRLVTSDRTRRVLPRSRLLEGLGAGAEEVLGRLLAARLLAVRQPTPADPAREVVVELAHESLIVAWARLRRWIDESREELALLAEIGQAAELWERRGERAEEVWQGDALHDAERAAERSTATLPPGVARFLEAGRRHALRGVRRRWWRVGGALALLALLAIAATVAALVIAGQKRSALSQRAEAERQGARAAERWRDLLEARARLRASLEIEDSTAARALFRRLADDPLIWRRRVAAVLHRVASSPGGDRIAVAGSDRLIYLLDVETGAIQRVLRGHTDQVLAVAFARDGRQLASGGWDGTVRLWDLASGRSDPLLARHQGAVWEAQLSPDGRTLATAGADGLVMLWEVSSRRRLRILRGHRAQVHALDYRRDGRRLASVGQDGTVRLWDPGTGSAVQTIPLGEPLHAVRFAPDGQLLAVGTESGRIEVRRLAGGARAFALEGHTAPIWGLAFSPDGARLASSTGGGDRSLRVWDLATRSLHRKLTGHSAMSWVAFTDARRLASASMDRSVSLWEIDRGQPRVEEEGHGGMVVGVGFSPDGQRLASGGLDRTVRLWRTATGEPAGVLEGHTAKIFAVAFSPDGKSLASGGLDKTVRLWDLRSSEPRHQLSHPDKVFDLAFSPDGGTLAVAVQDRRLYLWSTRTGQLARVLEGHAAPVHGVAFSPDGRSLASSGADRRVILWDAASGERLRSLEGHTGEVWGVAFSPDGRSLISAGGDRAAWLWAVGGGGAGRELTKLPGRLYWPAFHPDGERVGLPGSDGLSRICELQGSCRELRGHRAEVNTFRFSPDGRLAATTSDDGTLRLWDVARARPAWHAPALIATDAGVELCARDPAPRWWRLEGGGRSPLAGAEPWRAVCGSARIAVSSPTGKTLCSARFDDELELWDLTSGARRLARRVPGIQQLGAEPGACLTLAGGRIERHRPGRSELLVAGEASAFANDGPGLLVAAGAELRRLAPDGALRSRVSVDPGATAIGLSGGSIVLGYADGNLELALTSTGPRRGVSFEDVPASRVERILEGPRRTLIVGYANGLVGLWSLETGKRLDSARLHGPISHLLLRDRTLHAASELGRTLSWDLGDLYLDTCALLRKVWRQVPVVWEDGRATRRGPPAGHRCLER